MRKLCHLVTLAPAILLAAPLCSAQTTDADRSFLGFAEEAAIVENQWWEGQLDYQDWENFERTILRGIVAIRPWENVEVGGRVGFGSSDTDLADDGSGATDLDLWGKWHLASADNTEFAVGATATVPTGDDAVGLGEDAFSIGAFGSARHRLERCIINGYIGARHNGDGQIFGIDLEGRTSFRLGGGVLYPLSDRIVAVGEALLETDRFEDGDRDTRVLGGINWRVMNRSQARAALAFGLSDGAPDIEVILGWAARF